MQMEPDFMGSHPPGSSEVLFPGEAPAGEGVGVRKGLCGEPSAALPWSHLGSAQPCWVVLSGQQLRTTRSSSSSLGT